MNFKKRRLARLAIIGVCLIGQTSLLQASPVKSWTRGNNYVDISDEGGQLRIEICRSDIFHVLYFPKGTKAHEVTSPSVVKTKWAETKWDAREKKGDIIINTANCRIQIDKSTGRITYFDKKGDTLLSEVDGNSRTLTPATVMGENTYHASQRFISPADESIYGLEQNHEGNMDYRGYYLRLKQFNTVIALPFYFSTKGYGLFWNNASLTDFNPEKTELQTWIQASFDNSWTLYEPKTTGDYQFILDGLHDNGSVEMTIDELQDSDGVEKRISRKVINQDYDVIPTTLSGRVHLEAGKRYELNFRARFKHLYVRTPEMENTTELSSEVADQIDYYFFAGNADKAISSLRELTGEAPLFPRWAYGFTQSRYTYDTQQKMLDVAEGYRKRHYPLDVVVQDMNYWTSNDSVNTWGSHLYDKDRFPDPVAMYKQLHEKDKVHVLISVWPRINRQADLFDYFVNKGYSLGIQNTAGKSQEGITIKGEQDNVAIDPYNPEARKAYWNFMKERLWDKGVDGWWLDASEPEWGYDFHSSHTYAGSGARNLNTYSLMQSSAVYDGQRSVTNDKRVVILTRSAFPGQQRYATQCWSGDIGITWNTMKQQIPAGLNFSMAGMPYWSSDTGGFRPFMKTYSLNYRELVTRWFEMSTFLPIMRVHGCRDTEIWSLGKTEERIGAKYDRFRYRMLPYIYSLAARVTFDGYTILRGLAMDFPNDKNIRRIDDEFMMGSAFLVCPVTEYQARHRNVYLPEGRNWTNFWTGNQVKGGQTINAEAPLDEMPIYVPDGTILPLGRQLEYAAQAPEDTLELRIYPGRDADFNIYEDSGDGYQYEKGQHATIPLKWDNSKRELTIGDANGSFPGMLQQRTFHIVLVSQGKGTGMDTSASIDKTVTYRNKKISIKL